MDEITENKGVIFATGTPVSNTMTEKKLVSVMLANNEIGTIEDIASISRM